MSWFSRLIAAVAPNRLDDELHNELEFHVQMRTEELMRQGLAPEEARRQSTRRFGNGLRHRETSRDIRLLPRLESIFRDAVFGVRLMRKNPLVTLAAVLSLALAIGAST